MSAVRMGSGYITKGPPWARRGGGYKLGRLAFPPGRVPPQLVPYLLKKGDVSKIVSECKAEGKTGGEGLVRCIFSKVAEARRKK